MTDLLTFIPIIVIVILLLLLSNREIKKSLEHSKAAERVLVEDRNILQIKLEKSTQALRESELLRIIELTKAAEFGRLAQGLFHDLMTPLTSIILHTENLKNNKMAQKSLEKTVEAGNRMAVYLQDIRTTLSREESVRLCALRQELDIVINLLSYKIRTAGITIEIKEEGSCTREGNAVKLRQIFSNLISNSIDSFETKDDVQKKIDVLLTERANDILIQVSDNGCGISSENLNKVFDSFFTTKPIQKGTGIGLTTVKSIIEKDMGGKIELESIIGKGTTVKAILPKQYTNPVSSPPLLHTPLRHE